MNLPIEVRNQVKKPDPRIVKEIDDLKAMRETSRVKG